MNANKKIIYPGRYIKTAHHHAWCRVLSEVGLAGQFWAADSKGKPFSCNLKDITDYELTRAERDVLDGEIGYF